MGQWVQNRPGCWRLEIDLPFGRVEATVWAEPDPDGPGYMGSVEVSKARDPRYAEVSSGWADPLPLAAAQAACEALIDEWATYGPPVWLDAPPADAG